LIAYPSFFFVYASYQLGFYWLRCLSAGLVVMLALVLVV
jgi:hypothetical protein